MIVSYSWLNELGDFKLKPEEMADALTNVGIEVDEIIKKDNGITNCVIGKILDIWKHPQADKLSVTKIETLDGVFEIVCGADNLEKNRYVIVAKIGATLPGDVHIKKSKIRGVTSEGMLCSEDELRIPNDGFGDGIYLLPDEVDFHSDISKFIPAEDYFFEIELTSNRNDCLSVYGIARELSAITGVSLKLKDSFRFREQDGKIDIHVENHNFCPRFTGRLVKNIVVEKSPSWLSKRLEEHGIKSINNVVDYVNYEMLLYGNPMHVFDFDKLRGEKIIVRKAKKGETLIALGEKKIDLTEEDYVIADGERPVSLAGIIGGLDTSVTEETKTVLIEAAYFDMVTIRQTCRRHKIVTDSAYRYQRGVDIDMIPFASNYVLQFICNYDKVEVASSLNDFYIHKRKKREIILNYQDVRDMLGEEVELNASVKFLQHLGFKIDQYDKNQFKVVVPMYRYNDIVREVDLIEEIARFHGYNQFEAEHFYVNNQGFEHLKAEKNHDHEWIDRVINLGYFQVKTNSFIEESIYGDDHDLLRVQDPINLEQAFLRPDLIYPLLKTIKINENKNNIGVNRIFEIGKVFSKISDHSFHESKNLTMICYGRSLKNWYGSSREMEFYDLKGDVEELLEFFGVPFVDLVPRKGHLFFHDNICADIIAQGKTVGTMGIIDPLITFKMDINCKNIFVATLDMNQFVSMAKKKVKYKTISKYPSIFRDLAFVTKSDFDLRVLLRKIKTYSPFIQKVNIVDIYEGDKVKKGTRSVVFSIEYNDPKKTLLKEKIDAVEVNLIEHIVEIPEVSLR